MSFTWPLALLLGVTIPAVLGVYLWSLRRRKRRAVTYSSLALLRLAVPPAPAGAATYRSACCSGAWPSSPLPPPVPR